MTIHSKMMNVMTTAIAAAEEYQETLSPMMVSLIWRLP